MTPRRAGRDASDLDAGGGRLPSLVRARLRQVLAREADEVRPSHGGRGRDDPAHLVQRGGGDLPRLACGHEVRVGVEARPVGRSHRPLQEPRDQIDLGGGTQSDRIRQALVEGDAVMGDAGREVEHVAGLEHPLLLRAEAPQDTKVQPRPVGLDEPLGDAPAAPPSSLEEEDVVGVDVWPHRPLRRGQADHDVVHPPSGQEIEAVDEVRDLGHAFVHVLHEHRPVRPGEAPDERRRQRPRDELPRTVAAALDHEARLDVGAPGQREQASGRDRIAEAGERAAHEKRPLLPVAPQEGPRAQAAQQRGRHGDRARGPYFSRTGVKSRS